MRYEYANADGRTCEIDLPLKDDKPEAIIVGEKGWTPSDGTEDPAHIFRRVISMPYLKSIKDPRAKPKKHLNPEGTLNLPSGMCPYSLTMDTVHEQGEVLGGRWGDKEVQRFPDGTLATVERDAQTKQVLGGYPILDNKANTDRWEKKLGVVNRAK